ncbi:MAG: hypothetical protein I8H75_04655 [Myxococcaceae bacterium]|nr:hypothetical protein [Myxococcaceae bacterium]MBH2006614.1 hypothetical protein [Myxococcaceae bacterium]
MSAEAVPAETIEIVECLSLKSILDIEAILLLTNGADTSATTRSKVKEKFPNKPVVDDSASDAALVAEISLKMIVIYSPFVIPENSIVTGCVILQR